jgi:hypothetical protein
MNGIPKRWSDVVGERIVLHKLTGACDAPETLEELTDRTLALTEKALAAKSGVALGDAAPLPDDLRTRLFRNELAREALMQDIHAGVERLGDREVWLHYGGEPVIRPGIGKEVAVTVAPGSPPATASPIELRAPNGWRCERLGPARFRLLAPAEAIQSRNVVSVVVGAKGGIGDGSGSTVDFVLLGPDEAKGFEAGKNVERCPRCGARAEACFCATGGER